MTIAVGYGISWFSTETDPTGVSIDSTLKTFEDEYEFLGPLLGEFSVGYAFWLLILRLGESKICPNKTIAFPATRRDDKQNDRGFKTGDQ